MPRVNIDIDNMNHQIDSTDPEMIAKWIVEIFGRIHYPSPATWIRVTIYPSFVPHVSGQFGADWIADSRFFTSYQPKTPRELLEQISKHLDEIEAQT